MKISIFGLGYVGCVSAACLATDGHHVVGVDVLPTKVDLINAARSPIVEPGLEEMIARSVSSGRLSATTDGIEAVLRTDLSFVCVGTPSTANGVLDLQYVERVSADIGRALRQKDSYHLVVLRSTMLPGSMQETVVPTLGQVSGRQVGVDYGLAYNPEFLREGSAVADFFEPPRTVIGEFDQQSGDMVAEVYADLNAPLIRTDIKLAEMVKYADNSFHALKIAFANEIGVLGGVEGVDSRRLMDIFCQDTKLNISPAYLRPGYAFGGSCLPKDLRALTHRARERGVDVPVLESVLESNEAHKRRALALVEATGKKRVVVLGLSFKPQTDDLRESPAVELVQALMDKRYHLRLFDRNVALARLVGTNKEFIERQMPHLASLMVLDLESAIRDAEVVVVANGDAEFRNIASILGPDQVVVDLAGVVESTDELGERYIGIAW